MSLDEYFFLYLFSVLEIEHLFDCSKIYVLMRVFINSIILTSILVTFKHESRCCLFTWSQTDENWSLRNCWIIQSDLFYWTILVINAFVFYSTVQTHMYGWIHFFKCTKPLCSTGWSTIVHLAKNLARSCSFSPENLFNPSLFRMHQFFLHQFISSYHHLHSCVFSTGFLVEFARFMGTFLQAVWTSGLACNLTPLCTGIPVVEWIPAIM